MVVNRFFVDIYCLLCVYKVIVFDWFDCMVLEII